MLAFAYEIAVVIERASLHANSDVGWLSEDIRPLSGAACPSCAHVSNDCG